MKSGIFSVLLYLSILLIVGLMSRKKAQTSNDFILGSRKMNFWVTALAAHASDMSSWIFMAYPAVLFSFGLVKVWVAVGLCLFMFLNWQFVAPKIRVMTEKYGSLTLSSFFESRFNDTSGAIRVFTAIASFIFYIIYISSGFVGLGLLIESIFDIPYSVGTTLGIIAVIPYLFIGGYITLAWTDLFQGLFLFGVILLIPLMILFNLGGFEILENVSFKAMIPDFTLATSLSIFFSLSSWGLGYFGQPHIVTKFMGIKNPQDIPKSKWVGMSWQFFSLIGATLIGLVAVEFFKKTGINDPQLVFIKMVLQSFSPLVAAFILCAILGTTITCTDSQILVLISNLTEDFYKKILRKKASSKELILVSRASIFLITA
ncbi:MAG: sodium/proline symporter, partial [Chlamydiae bacterium]|nr:sodium/proline symporter [Chlamydiota bacterium]